MHNKATSSELSYGSKFAPNSDLSLFAVRVLNCGIVYWNEFLLNHLNGQSRFANTTTTNNNELVFVTGHERSRIL
jgi:hypothetical protein